MSRPERVPAPIRSPRRLDLAGYVCRDYRREVLHTPHAPGHALRSSVIPGMPADDGRLPPIRMSIKVDFRTTHGARRDLGGDKVPAPDPGSTCRMSSLVTRADGRSVVPSSNGNNVGYWGNQFVIDYGEFPLQAPRARCSTTGSSCGCMRPARPRLLLRSQWLSDHQSCGGRKPPVGRGHRVGLSARPRTGRAASLRTVGFPPAAERPGDLARPRPARLGPALCCSTPRGSLPRGRYDYTMLRSVIEELVACDAPLARHPMTVIGLDQRGDIVLLVVERSQRSPGMTVDEAASPLLEPSSTGSGTRLCWARPETRNWRRPTRASWSSRGSRGTRRTQLVPYVPTSSIPRCGGVACGRGRCPATWPSC